MAVVTDTRRRHPDAHGTSTALYGTIVVLAVIVGVSTDPGVGVGYVLGVVVVTALVFWAAHVYTDVVAVRLVGTERRWGELLRAQMFAEAPLLEAAVPPATVLALGAAGVLTRGTALTLAVASGLVELFVCGAVIGRSAGQGRFLVVLSGLLNAGLGVLIVLLKALLHH